MNKPQELSGAKGGGGAQFRNRPDNLRSEDTFEALLGLVTGKIRGLAPGGLKNYFVNDVPLEDGSGNLTLKDFNILLDVGDPTVLNAVKLQLGGSSGPISVNLAVDNPNPSGPGDWRYATVSTPGVTHIDLRFLISQLFEQTESGINNETLSLEIELQPSGATGWTNPLQNVTAPQYNSDGISVAPSLVGYMTRGLWDEVDDTVWKENYPGKLRITGKTTQPYVKEIRISVPNEDDYENVTWQIRCRLVEKDTEISGAEETRRTVVWESAAGVINEPIGGTEEWRGLAYLVLTGLATDQLTGVPKLEGIFDLAEVSVPPASVWDPETRVYSGATWDGTTTELKWTQCPAWQLKDLIENETSGFASLVPGSTLDKWDCLEASKWYSELVPDGKGGTHPRYSMNYLLNSPMRLDELVQYVTGATGSYAWDRGDGTWRLMVEKPEDSVALFTKEDITGEFLYSHSDIDTRYNEIIGVFNNEDLNYQEDRVRVYDQGHIDVYGLRSTTIVLMGCTNRQEALRRCKIRQLSSLYETKQVTFMTNRKATLIQPFNLISIADADLGMEGQNTTDRILDMDGTTLTLGQYIYLEPGVSYALEVTVPNEVYDGEPITEPADGWKSPTKVLQRTVMNTVTQAGITKTLQIDSALPADTPPNATVALSAEGLPAIPRQYRVLTVEPNKDQEGMLNVTAVELLSTKWAVSDAITETAIASQTRSEVPSPTDLSLAIDTYPAKYQSRRVLSAQWTRPDTDWFDSFRVSYRYNGGAEQILETSTPDTYVELPEPVDGLYEFIIVTKDRRGQESKPLTGTTYLGEVPPPGTSRLSLSTTSVTIKADSGGVPLSDELPCGGWAKFQVGDTEVNSLVTWSITGYGCTVSIDTSGVWTITDMESSGKLVVSGEFEGLTLTQTVFTTLEAAPESEPEATVTSVTGRAVSNTSFGTNPVIPYATIDSGSSGAIDVKSYIVYKGTEGAKVTAKLVYRPASGGAWTDAHTAQTGSEVQVTSEDFGGGTTEFTLPGTLSITTKNITGLTADTDYEIGLFTLVNIGSVTLQGSFTSETA